MSTFQLIMFGANSALTCWMVFVSFRIMKKSEITNDKFLAYYKMYNHTNNMYLDIINFLKKEGHIEAYEKYVIDKYTISDGQEEVSETDPD